MNALTWLRCVDHQQGADDYPLNPAHVIAFKRRDGWWRAFDIRGDSHDVSGDDDAKVEALLAGTVPRKPRRLAR